MTAHGPTTALATHERAELAQQPAPAIIFASAIAQLLRAAGDGTDAGKVRELYAIAKEMKADYAKEVFKAALSRIQKDLPRISKEGRIDHLKQGYAKYEDIDKVVRPLLAAEGFAVSFDTTPSQGSTVFSCELSHREGHSEVRRLALPIDNSGGKNAIQGMGSSVSYAKRYLLGMHLNIITVGEDDDGNGGQVITRDQVAFLREELATFVRPGEDPIETKKREAAVLRVVRATSLETIPARSFETVVNWIETKRTAAVKK